MRRWLRYSLSNTDDRLQRFSQLCFTRYGDLVKNWSVSAVYLFSVSGLPLFIDPCITQDHAQRTMVRISPRPRHRHIRSRAQGQQRTLDVRLPTRSYCRVRPDQVSCDPASHQRRPQPHPRARVRREALPRRVQGEPGRPDWHHARLAMAGAVGRLACECVYGASPSRSSVSLTCAVAFQTLRRHSVGSTSSWVRTASFNADVLCVCVVKADTTVRPQGGLLYVRDMLMRMRPSSCTYSTWVCTCLAGPDLQGPLPRVRRSDRGRPPARVHAGGARGGQGLVGLLRPEYVYHAARQ